jgi:GH24 family phage-related lysozyme (muramidase)
MLASQYLDAIKSSEGYQATPKWDYKQWTSGYGTRASGPDEVLDKAGHEQRFSDEVGKASSYVDSIAPNAPEGVKAALTSLTFNAGNTWANSGLGAAVRAGDYDTARNHFLQYNKAGGEFNQGLADRRAREAAWFDPNNRLVNKMAGIDDYMYGDPTPKGRGALFSPPQAPAAPQEQPSFIQNLLNNGTGALFGMQNSEGLGSQLQNAGAGLMAINNPSALSLIAASRAKQATTPYEVHIGRDGTAYRVNKATGEVTKLPGGNDEKKAAELKQREQTADVVTTDIDRVGGIVNGSGLPSTGAVGSVLQGLPGTNSHDVNELLRGIKSNVGFDRLQQMRASSPTGGALGAVSDTENKLLQSAIGSLEQSQSKEQFMQNLARVKQIYGQVIHGPDYKVEGTPSGAAATAPTNIPGVRSIKQIK